MNGRWGILFLQNVAGSIFFIYLRTAPPTACYSFQPPHRSVKLNFFRWQISAVQQGPRSSYSNIRLRHTSFGMGAHIARAENNHPQPSDNNLRYMGSIGRFIDIYLKWFYVGCGDQALSSPCYNKKIPVALHVCGESRWHTLLKYQFIPHQN